MKSEKLELLLVILVVLLILFTYARYNKIEQRMTRESIQDLNMRLEELITTIKKSDMQFKFYADSLKAIEDKVAFADMQRSDLSSRVEALSSQVQTLMPLLTAGKDPVKKSVDLGSVSVKKKK